MANHWDKLIKATLTGQFSPSEIYPVIAAQWQDLQLPLPPHDTTEQLLLKTIGSYALLHKFAQKVTPVASTAAVIAASTSIINKKSTQQLLHILHQSYPSILQELLYKIAASKQYITPSLLPLVLDYCKNKPNLYTFVLPCLGERGNWLATQNDDWKYALPIDLQQQDIFYYGNKKERVAYFSSLRQVDSAAALHLLQEVWDSEDAANKTSFLSSLEIQLSEQDLDFLELAQQDKRKSVRATASQLLAQIPTSSLAQRMQQLAKQWITLEGKQRKLIIELPQQTTEAMELDGINASTKVLAGKGKQLNILAQVLSKIPPHWWTQNYDCSPSDWLQLIDNNESRDLFLWSWSQAAYYYNNEEWLIALHRYHSQTWHEQQAWQNLLLPYFYTKLSPSVFDTVVKIYLEADQLHFLQQETPLTELLLQENYAWSMDVSRLVLQRLQKILLLGKQNFLWNIKAILKRAAVAAHPAIFPTIIKDWEHYTNNNNWGSSQKDVDNFLHLLRFRYEIQTNN